jgi:hypothetical protein
MIQELVVTNSDGTSNKFIPADAITKVGVPLTRGVLFQICPGTISAVKGGQTVAGMDTAFTATFAIGDKIAAGSEIHIITKVMDDNNLETGVWNNDVNNQPYGVIQMK